MGKIWIIDIKNVKKKVTSITNAKQPRLQMKKRSTIIVINKLFEYFK